MSEQKLSFSLNAFIHAAEKEGASLAGARLSGAWKSVANDQILKHTGAVIYDKRKADTVVIYTDTAHWAAELNAQKEIFRLLLSAALKLPEKSFLEEIRFVTSRRSFVKYASLKVQQDERKPKRISPISLSAEEEGHARDSLNSVKDEKLQNSLFKAMKTNLEWKKGLDALKEPQRGKRKPEI